MIPQRLVTGDPGRENYTRTLATCASHGLKLQSNSKLKMQDSLGPPACVEMLLDDGTCPGGVERKANCDLMQK